MPRARKVCDTFLKSKVAVCRTYRLSQNVRPLIWVECTVEKHSRSRTEYLVKARSQFKERSSASNVEISLPLPPDAITPTVRASQVPSQDCSRYYALDLGSEAVTRCTTGF